MKYSIATVYILGLLSLNAAPVITSVPSVTTTISDIYNYTLTGQNTLLHVQLKEGTTLPDGLKLSYTGNNVTKLAAIANYGYNDANNSQTLFNTPSALTVDGNFNVYVADTFNHIIRKILPNGTVTTIAGEIEGGDTDGNATVARFNKPQGINLDNNGNLYICDTGNKKIRKITPQGNVTTLVTLTDTPKSVAVNGSSIYVIDDKNILRMVSNDGNTTQLSLFPDLTVQEKTTFETGITLDSLAIKSDGTLYIGGTGYYWENDGGYAAEMVFKRTTEGNVSLLHYTKVTSQAGTSPFTRTTGALALDTAGSLYITETASNTITKITSAGTKTTVAATYPYMYPRGLSVDSNGTLYVADRDNHRIQKITSEGSVSTLAGSNRFTATTRLQNSTQQAKMNEIVIDGSSLYIVDNGFPYSRILKMTNDGNTSVLAGGELLFDTPLDGNGTSASFTYTLNGITKDNTGNLFVVDNRTIRKITPQGAVTTLYSDSDMTKTTPFEAITFYSDSLYILDSDKIRKFSSNGTENSTFSSPDSLSGPKDLTFDSSGNLYVTDNNNNVIKKFNTSGIQTAVFGNSSTCSSIDGNASTATFCGIKGISVDSNYIYVTQNDRIRKISSSGIVTTIAGGGEISDDSNGSLHKFSELNDISIDQNGTLYVVSAEGLHSVKQASKAWSITGKITTPGTYPISLVAWDDTASTEQTFSLDVTYNNTAPSITSIGDVEFNLQKLIDPINITITDQENNPLDINVTGLPEGLTFDGQNRQIIGTPTKIGLYPVSITVSDGNLTSNITFKISIIYMPSENNPLPLTTNIITSTEWNLLGSSYDVNVSDLVKFKTNTQIVWLYSEGTWKGYSPDTAIMEQITSRGHIQLDIIPANFGFWIK